MPKPKRVYGDLYENPELLKEFALDTIRIINSFIEDKNNKIKEEDVVNRITNPKVLADFKKSLEFRDLIIEKHDIVDDYVKKNNLTFVQGYNRVVYTRIKLPNEDDNKIENETMMQNATKADYVANILNKNLKKAYDIDYQKFLKMNNDEKIDYYMKDPIFCDEMFVVTAILNNIPYEINPKVREDYLNKKSIFENIGVGKDIFLNQSNYLNLIIPDLSKVADGQLIMAKQAINDNAMKFFGKCDDFYQIGSNGFNKVNKLDDDILAITVDKSREYFKKAAEDGLINKTFMKEKAFYGVEKGKTVKISADTTLSFGKVPIIKELPEKEAIELKEGLNSKLIISLDEYEKAYDNFTNKKNIKALNKLYKQLIKTESKKIPNSKEYNDVKVAYEDIINSLNTSLKNKTLNKQAKADLVEKYNKLIDNLREKIDIFEEKEILRDDVKNIDKNYARYMDRLDVMANIVNSIQGPITSIYKEENQVVNNNELTTSKIDVNELNNEINTNIESDLIIKINDPVEDKSMDLKEFK